MKMVCRVAALLAVAHANLNTGIDDLSVSLLQTRAEKIHKPHHQKTSTSELLSSSSSNTNKDQDGTEDDHTEVSMEQVVKENRNSDKLGSESDIAKLVDQVKVLAKDEAEVSKTVSKEVSEAREREASTHKTKKVGTWEFFDELLGKPTASPDLNLDQDKKSGKKAKKAIDVAEQEDHEITEGKGKKNHAGRSSHNSVDEVGQKKSEDQNVDKQRKVKEDDEQERMELKKAYSSNHIKTKPQDEKGLADQGEQKGDKKQKQRQARSGSFDSESKEERACSTLRQEQ